MQALMTFLLLMPAAKEPSWVDGIVLIKNHAVKIGHADAQGRPVMLAELDGVPYRVLAQHEGKIKIRTRYGITGWFEQSGAVLLAQAVPYFTARIEQNPQDAKAFNSRAIARQLQGQTEDALKDFAEAIRLLPTASAFYNNRALTWEDLNEHDKAIADYGEAIRLRPDFALFHRNRRMVHFKRKAYDKALLDDMQAVRLEPRDAENFLNRGIDYRMLKEYDKATADFDEVIRRLPNYPLGYLQRGMVWRAKQDYVKALADFSAAMRLQPQSALGVNQVAWLLATAPDARVRDGKRAIALAKRAQELDKAKASFYADTLAAAYAEDGDFDEAVRCQEKALQDVQLKNDPEARRRLEAYRNKEPYREK